MDPKVREHVAAWNRKHGYSADNDEDIWETLVDAAEHVWSGDEDQRRWWTEYFHVVSLNGMFIGFTDAKTTGDDSARDKGWEPDFDSVCEVEPVEVRKTEFRRKV